MYKFIPLMLRQQTHIAGHPARTLLVRAGIILTAASGLYLLIGMAGGLPLSAEPLAWNNIRVIAGLTILGCLMAAVGYGTR